MLESKRHSFGLVEVVKLASMLLGHEHFYPVFMRAVERVAESGRVLDVGTTHKFRKEIEPFTGLFRDYIAVDFHASPAYADLNVDIDADIRQLPLRSESFDGVLCIEVLEHVPDPSRAVSELHRVLQPGGVMLLTVPFMLGYHGKIGDYDDFFRYTDDGLYLLLHEFKNVRVEPRGGLVYRVLVTLVPDRLSNRMFRSPVAMRLINAFDKRRATRSPAGWIVFAQK
ncbi:MAG: methyltransferase domain-containing protein [Actinomycetota bacterium]|nr:methyltransferase domain-containing protein [Actinomycetota bacterium]